MYISSADLMTRNTERRVEIACPIDSPEVRARLHDILFAMRHDTVKARVLQPDGSYQKKPSVPEAALCAGPADAAGGQHGERTGEARLRGGARSAALAAPPFRIN